ncbi:MAG: cysteine desulfurase family protein [Paracoccaceae bacterium]
MKARVYLDWNATAPLRAEAREAMLRAMDAVGNPSSVHAEGRAARAIVESARRQLAEAAGLSGGDIVFTSGATEAAALALRGRDCAAAEVEHECVAAWAGKELAADRDGRVSVDTPGAAALQVANGETGVIQNLPKGLHFTDAVQAFGKIPFGFAWTGARTAALSAHKFGGPKGIGALLMTPGFEVQAQLLGGGQEMGRRSGTENVIGIAGAGAAAQAAQRDLDAGVWEQVEKLRDDLEERLRAEAPELVIFGKGGARLPNTSNFAVPGWKGETQVMQMDLAGFAVSAGSACSSGKVKVSRVLQAMGFDDVTASSAIRVSMGPTTTAAEVMAFGDTWIEHYRRWRARAA